MIRTIELASRSIVDTESRLVRLSFSSEEPVTRQSFFSDPWIEILGHERSEVDLSRLNNSAPVLYNHDRSERENRIGVVERAWVENGRGYADIRISRRDEVAGLWQDITDGIPELATGDRFTIDGKEFELVVIRPDSEGITELMLEAT
jgi:hypothetical protein